MGCGPKALVLVAVPASGCVSVVAVVAMFNSLYCGRVGPPLLSILNPGWVEKIDLNSQFTGQSATTAKAMTNNNIRGTAYHEAAHAVVAHAFGQRVARIHISPDHDDRGCTTASDPSSTEDRI